MKLKRELQARSDDLIDLKKENRRILEKNEKLNIEMDTLRATTRFGDQQSREIDRIGDLNRTMSVEVETLRKSVSHLFLFIP